MLLIAIGFGSMTDPFTCSTTAPNYYVPETGEGLNIINAKACRDYICKEKDLRPEWVDEVLVVDSPNYGEEPEVIHHHTEFE